LWIRNGQNLIILTYDCSHLHFQPKNDLKIDFQMVFFWESLVLSQIANTEISICILSNFIGFLYWFCDLAHPWFWPYLRPNLQQLHNPRVVEFGILPQHLGSTQNPNTWALPLPYSVQVLVSTQGILCKD